jgi:very-short-patch-repair endonuclease
MISLNGIAVFCALDTRKAKASIVDRVLNTVRKSNESLQCLYENRIRAFLKLHGLLVKDEVTIDDTKYRADILIRSHKAIIEVYERKHGHNKKRDKALKGAGYSILYLCEEDFEKLQSDELSIALFKAVADFLEIPLIPKEDSDSDDESENESGDESNEEDNR